MRKLFILGGFLLAGCASPLVSEPLSPTLFPYAPRTSQNLSGSIVVHEFKDLRPGSVGEYRIDIETSDGSKALLGQTVGELVADALKREFRQARIETDSGRCHVEGEVRDISVNWTLLQSKFNVTIRYLLWESTTLLDQTYSSSSISSESHGDQVLFARYLHATLAANIAQFMASKNFLEALPTTCSGK